MPPYLLLSLMLGALYGTVFHLWRGQGFKDLAIYLIAGIIGFILGQAVGNLLGLSFFLIGPLHFIEATILSWVGLFVAQWLKI
jgi:hypothetical protein